MNDKAQRQIVPVLVPASQGEPHDGVANFHVIREGPRTRSGPKVRVVRNRDLTESAIRKALGQDYDLLTATLDLKKARETGDALLQRRAYSKLMPHLGLADWDPEAFSYPGWANVFVPRLATAPLEGARLVLWFCSGRFIPAIYCPDLKTAIFVRAFLSFQTCPYCGKIFAPDKNNVVYCRPSHSNAHRMARMRARRGKRGRK
jgi:hypothetical protein